MSNWTKPLPDLDRTKYSEYHAKVVLERLFPESLKNMEVKDKPDLQHPDGLIGIEVTQAIPPKQKEAESLYSKIQYGSIRDEENAKNRIKKCGCEYKNGILQGMSGTDSFKHVLGVLESKLKTINKGEYTKFDEYGLFIFSEIYSDDNMKQEALNTMVKMSKDYSISFNQIMVYVPESLYIFGIKQQTWRTIGISSNMQSHMACVAREMVENHFSTKKLQALIRASKGDKELLRNIFACLQSFEAYHQAIFAMESWAKIYDYDVLEREEYQDKLTTMDKVRTACHNALLDKINILNRMAVKAGIGPIYGGTVSPEMPYRRQVADAVLSFVESVVSSRR